MKNFIKGAGTGAIISSVLGLAMVFTSSTPEKYNDFTNGVLVGTAGGAIGGAIIGMNGGDIEGVVGGTIGCVVGITILIAIQTSKVPGL
jgi:hypothetical protein